MVIIHDTGGSNKSREQTIRFAWAFSSKPAAALHEHRAAMYSIVMLDAICTDDGKAQLKLQRLEVVRGSRRSRLGLKTPVQITLNIYKDNSCTPRSVLLLNAVSYSWTMDTNARR
jgi:hypothetical protein